MGPPGPVLLPQYSMVPELLIATNMDMFNNLLVRLGYLVVISWPNGFLLLRRRRDRALSRAPSSLSVAQWIMLPVRSFWSGLCTDRCRKSISTLLIALWSTGLLRAVAQGSDATSLVSSEVFSSSFQ